MGQASTGEKSGDLLASVQTIDRELSTERTEVMRFYEALTRFGEIVVR